MQGGNGDHNVFSLSFALRNVPLLQWRERSVIPLGR